MKTLNVNLVTADEIEIAGKYIPGSLPHGVIFLHARPATKESWDAFAEQVSEAGFHTLAIDLRGHGHSGGKHYESMNDEETQKSILDVITAVEYLHKQNPDMKIGFVGASIGANLALQYAAANPASFVALLSAGLNYRGIETGRTAVSLPDDLPIYFITALDDSRVEGNSTQTETLYNACSSTKKSLKVFREGGHGTEIFQANPEFPAELLAWIKESTALVNAS
jgi:pimeloyl-ACP methyl ester carboxylesterase